jgi:starvation-inducible outer membrane lipoprotein
LPWLVGAAALFAGGLVACGGGAIPKQYLQQADTDVTLTKLVRHPDAYRGRVVILGGVIVEEKPGDNRVWLRMKNRPLDLDYVPHIPVAREGPEAGDYWVMVAKQDLPPDYRHWARVTVIGRVMGGKMAFDEAGSDERIKNIVLSAIYIKGWDRRLGGYGVHETDDSGGAGSAAGPRGVLKNSSQ